MSHKNSLKIVIIFAFFAALIGCGPRGGFNSSSNGQVKSKLDSRNGYSELDDSTNDETVLQDFVNDYMPEPKLVLPIPAEVSSAGTLGILSDHPREDVAAKGTVKPTIYYFPVINEDQVSCKSKVSMLSREGGVLAHVCARTLEICSLQGACAIVQNKILRTFNINGRLNERDRFFESTDGQCKYGFGVKSSCLDPFYTIAADLKIYKPGDVIYVPTVKGLELPDGTKHDGYFIVRDSGRDIIGAGRFDFFSGYYSWRDEENPFKQAGLGNKQNRFLYFKMKGATARAVLEKREFPRLPEDTIDQQP